MVHLSVQEDFPAGLRHFVQPGFLLTDGNYLDNSKSTVKSAKACSKNMPATYPLGSGKCPVITVPSRL
jgi:hypothetical protein